MNETLEHYKGLEPLFKAEMDPKNRPKTIQERYENAADLSYQAYLDAINRDLATRVRLTISLKDHLKKQLKKRAQDLDNGRESICLLIRLYLDTKEVNKLCACEKGVFSGKIPLFYQNAFWEWKDLYPEAWEDYQECAKREPGFLKKLWLIAVKLHLQYAYHMIKKEAENGESPKE